MSWVCCGRSGLRGLAGALVLVSMAAAAQAQDLWYVAYRDGVQAFNKGDDQTAERKLLEALNNNVAPKARGRSVLYYGSLRGEFLPEYYLAVIYTREHRYREAVDFAKRAEAYLRANDKAYPQLAAARTEAEKALAAPANAEARSASAAAPANAPASARAGAPPSAGSSAGAAPAPSTPTASSGNGSATASASAQRELDRLIKEASGLAAAGKFAEARQDAGRAKALGVSGTRADDLLKTIDIADLSAQLGTEVKARAWARAAPLADRLSSLDPGNAAARAARPAISRGLASDAAARDERAGIAAFYHGSYEQAIATLARVPAALATPRVLFYTACSTAALALLEGDKGAPQLEKARETFARARPSQATFTPDRKYISPRILQALEEPR